MTIEQADNITCEKIGKKCASQEYIYDGFISCDNGKYRIGGKDNDITCYDCHGTEFEPIGLADVLMALNGKLLKDYTISSISLSNKTLQLMIPVSCTDRQYCGDSCGEYDDIEWNLTKTYDQQEESVRLAIANLLQNN